MEANEFKPGLMFMYDPYKNPQSRVCYVFNYWSNGEAMCTGIKECSHQTYMLKPDQFKHCYPAKVKDLI